MGVSHLPIEGLLQGAWPQLIEFLAGYHTKTTNQQPFVCSDVNRVNKNETKLDTEKKNSAFKVSFSRFNGLNIFLLAYAVANANSNSARQSSIKLAKLLHCHFLCNVVKTASANNRRINEDARKARDCGWRAG